MADQEAGREGRVALGAGVLAALAMAVFYSGVVIGASDSIRHFREQIATDWYLLLPIVAGFAIQVGLLVELHRRRRMGAGNAAAGVAGAGASSVGMVACCAHHVADLVPFVGATAAATFLYSYRVPFMLVGAGLNAVGITLAFRRLRGTSAARRLVTGVGEGRHEEIHGSCATG